MGNGEWVSGGGGGGGGGGDVMGLMGNYWAMYSVEGEK